jgi:methionyl-tRNA formyltransferase
MKVLFFGYSQLGARTVDLLVSRGDDIVAVVTHRDDPREQRWYRTPAEAAAAHGLRVLNSEELADAGTALATSEAPDLVLSVMYRELLPEAVLAAPRRAALNLHPSLLPAYRGRAPINWVLVNGETVTGVSLHHMVSRADAGDLVAQQAIPIAPRETALSLYLKVEEAGVALLAATLPLVAAGTAPRSPQDPAHASVFGRRRPEDGRIDWSWPAARIDCLVRAVAPPWPGAFGELAGRTVRVLEGEPAEPLPAAPARPVPGTLHHAPEGVCVATADRWFRLLRSEGLDPAPPAPHSHPAVSPSLPTRHP